MDPHDEGGSSYGETDHAAAAGWSCIHSRSCRRAWSGGARRRVRVTCASVLVWIHNSRDAFYSFTDCLVSLLFQNSGGRGRNGFARGVCRVLRVSTVSRKFWIHNSGGRVGATLTRSLGGLCRSWREWDILRVQVRVTLGLWPVHVVRVRVQATLGLCC